MDRVNISFAAESMNRDLHFSAQVYGLGAGLFFLSYAACEVPSNRLLVRFGARRWMARIMLTWGLIAAAMVLVRTPWSFYTMRLLLGVAEAGFFPGAIYYLSQWFPAGQRARAISLFYVALPLSSVVMGSVAGALLGLNGRLGLAGWQWLFLVEALPAVLLSAVVFFMLPDGPHHAAWLNAPEKAAIAEALRLEAELIRPTQHGRAILRRVLKTPYVWVMGLFYFLTLGSNYAVAFSLPVVLKAATGLDAGRVGWIVAGYGVVGALAMVLTARRSDARGERRLHILVPVGLMAISLAGAALGLTSWIAVAGLLIAYAVFCAMQGPILSLWPNLVEAECAPEGIAVINMFGIAGGFAGPYWMGYLRDATGGYAVGIGSLSVAVAVAIGIGWGMLKKLGTVPGRETAPVGVMPSESPV
jgi:ACS family tartrate transporter-like MFS transporter